MSNVTVNISFQKSLLDEIDAEAKKESRSRSELVREATRLYVQRQRRWEDVFKLGDRQTEKLGLTEGDVTKEIKQVRKRRRTSS